MIALRIIFSDEETGLGAYPGLVFMRRGAPMNLLLTQRAPGARVGIKSGNITFGCCMIHGYLL